MKNAIATVLLTSTLAAGPLYAETAVSSLSSWWDGVTDDVATTWNVPQHTDVYLPFISWHAR
ncbi:MAG: hypothetical protein E7J78_17740 [Pantoea sp.]|nr:hypothetical protein [Pantoea sp.]